MFVLPTERACDRIIPTKAGWIACPVCGYPRLKKISEDESAELVYIHCRRCKNEIPLTLKQGQSLQGQSQRVV